MKVAVVCSAHGFGHLTRSLALAEALRSSGADPTVLTASPEVAVAWDPRLQVEAAVVDVGFVQIDGVTEDVPATAAALESRCADAHVDLLAERLSSFDLVVADTPPSALEAARRAGVPAVAVGNFDWAWIYGHYEGLEWWSDRFRRWQEPHPGIQLWPGPGLRGFRRVARAGLLGRRSAPDATVAPGSVLVAFSAHGLPGGASVLPRMEGTTWIVDDELVDGRADLEPMGGRRFPGLVAAADVVLTKPGYGIVAEALLAGTRIAWFPRGRFPEAPSLEAVLRGRATDPRVEAFTPAAVRVAVASALETHALDAVGDPEEAMRVAGLVLGVVGA